MNSELFTLLISVLSTISLSAQTSHLSDPLLKTECQAWVDSVYNTMMEEERIAQLIIENIAPNQGDRSKSVIKNCVTRDHVGGIYLSEGSADNFVEMTNYAQSLTKVPLLFAIDGEWGPSMRVSDAPLFPRNMTLGAIDDLTLIYEYGKEVGRQCKLLGVDMNFAPVLDVNSNPANPVIGDRSFGEDPYRVAELGRAFSLGMESEGVMAVGKHFPGHGDTDSDSHKTLPTVTHTKHQLQTVDLVPFRTFIDAGCSGVMVGHLDIPAYDKSHRPGSMSKAITTDLLQEELGFDGLVITDALGMKGASVNGNLCVAALKAGTDILLNPTNIPNDIKEIKKAVERGEIPMSEIERRCKKVLAYKYALGLTHVTPLDANEVKASLRTPQTDALMQRLADAAITVISDSNTLPIGKLDKNKIAVVNIGDNKNPFTDYCRKYADVEVFSSKDGTFSSSTLNKIKGYDVIIAAVYDHNANAQNTLAQLKNARCLVPVFFINPYKVAKFKNTLSKVPTVMFAYKSTPELQRAAAKGFFGGIEVSGRLPVNVDGVGSAGEGINIKKSRLGYSSPAAKGMNPDLSYKMDSVVTAALNAGAFPGAQVLVVKDGDVVFDRSYGLTTYGGEKVTDGTVYDLASVSKTVGTLPGVMKAYDLGLFDLDASASQYIPGLDVDGKREITPRMLLHHETGMPASLNMYKVMMDSNTYTGNIVQSKRDKAHTVAITGGGYGHNKAKMRDDIISRHKSDKYNIAVAKDIYTGQMGYDTIMANIYRANVKPSRKYVYSCLNFCLLMDLEQQLTKVPHQQWVTDSVWAPIGAYNFCYRPTERFSLDEIAATENDTYLRKQHVHGYVHDELAAFSGGVQGNAGVFGTATDIAKLCQMWLNGGEYGDVRVLSNTTNELFTTEKSEACHRGLGFDKPNMTNKNNSSTCDEASAATYGHTGFTGTCFWVDPESDLIFVFLSNRVDPSRSNKAFSDSKVRPTLMSLVYQSME